MRKFLSEDKLVHYFPEDSKKNLDVGSVVCHVDHKDSTIGFVTKIEPDPDRDLFDQIKRVTKKISGPENGPEVDEFAKQLTGEKVARNRCEIEWSSPPPEIEFRLPSIRRVMNYPKIAKDLVSIQPMTLPVGGIFYHEYKYGSNKVTSKEETCLKENLPFMSGIEPMTDGSDSYSPKILTSSIEADSFISRISKSLGSIFKSSK